MFLWCAGYHIRKHVSLEKTKVSGNAFVDSSSNSVSTVWNISSKSFRNRKVVSLNVRNSVHEKKAPLVNDIRFSSLYPIVEEKQIRN